MAKEALTAGSTAGSKYDNVSNATFLGQQIEDKSFIPCKRHACTTMDLLIDSGRSDSEIAELAQRYTYGLNVTEHAHYFMGSWNDSESQDPETYVHVPNTSKYNTDFNPSVKVIKIILNMGIEFALASEGITEQMENIDEYISFDTGLTSAAESINTARDDMIDYVGKHSPDVLADAADVIFESRDKFDEQAEQLKDSSDSDIFDKIEGIMMSFIKSKLDGNFVTTTTKTAIDPLADMEETDRFFDFFMLAPFVTKSDNSSLLGVSPGNVPTLNNSIREDLNVRILDGDISGTDGDAQAAMDAGMQKMADKMDEIEQFFSNLTFVDDMAALAGAAADLMTATGYGALLNLALEILPFATKLARIGGLFKLFFDIAAAHNEAQMKILDGAGSYYNG